MAVIRDGKAVWLGGGAPAAPRAEEREHAADDDGPTTDGPSVDKKLRALRKKLRRVAVLKERRRRGEELDAAQQADRTRALPSFETRSPLRSSEFHPA